MPIKKDSTVAITKEAMIFGLYAVILKIRAIAWPRRREKLYAGGI